MCLDAIKFEPVCALYKPQYGLRIERTGPGMKSTAYLISWIALQCEGNENSFVDILANPEFDKWWQDWVRSISSRNAQLQRTSGTGDGQETAEPGSNEQLSSVPCM